MTDTELIEIREQARVEKNWILSDQIREYLDTKHSFIFDTKNGQVIYHCLSNMTRGKLIQNLNKDIKANKQFDSWLYSIRSSILK